MSWNHYEGGPAPSGTGPAQAVSTVQQVMGQLQSQAQSFIARTESILNALGTVQVPPIGDMPPISITKRDNALDWPAPKLEAVGDPGSLEVTLPSDPGLPSISTGVSLAIPDWSPSVVSINIPDTPTPVDTSGVPSRPDVDTAVELPATPALAMPVLESLDQITVPTFTFPALPTFSDAAPQFTDAAPSAVINWAEPQYASESLTEVQATIKRMMAGGTGLKPEIEQQLFDRARAREDQTAAKAVAEAFDTFANKGFTMPPGALAAQVNAAREQAQLQANSLQRDVMIKVADIEQENLRFAVQQGLAAENLLINIFNNAAQRSFEMARFTVESQIQLFNSKVSLFNAVTSAYQTRAQVYKIQIDAALAQLDVYRIQLEGQKVVSEINVQRVQAYNARVQALMAQVEVYKAQMEGARIRTDAIRTQIEAYRTDVEAYSSRVNADKVRFDAYRTQVEGETAKIGITEAEARVYAARASAAEAAANVRVQAIRADIEKMQATTGRFAALVDRSKAELQAKLGKVEANARVAGLNIQHLSAQSDANRAKSEAIIRIGEQELQSNIAITSASIERYKVAVQKILQEADLKARSLQAAGQMASTLAGGAMAAQHVQASISSTASDSTSVAFGYSQSASEAWNYTPTSTGT